MNQLIKLTAILLISLVSSVVAFSAGEFRTRISSQVELNNSSIDVEAEVLFGKEVAARILGQFDGVENDSLQRYTNLVGQTLVQVAGRSDIDFHFYIIESEDINAYATPGGYIFVTSAAVQQMTDESELAAVLAHEIAHVVQKHIVNALSIKGVDSGAGLSQLLGGGNESMRVAFTQALDLAVNLLFEKGLQANDEYDADEYALLILAGAGYDPIALTRYLERVSDSNEAALETVTHTHPRFSDRLRNLSALIVDHELEGLNFSKNASRFRSEIKNK